MEKNTNNAKSAIGSIVANVILAATCVVCGWFACEMWPKKEVQKKVQEQAAVTVAVTNVTMRAYNLPEKFVAHAEPVQEVELLPQVDGYIKEIRFKEGDIVKTGDILYVLDGERYQAVANQRKADLATAEAEERRATRYLERLQKADARGVTQLELDNAVAGAESAKAAVLQAKANLVVAEYDLKKTTVIAPISGQIGKTLAHIGDYVSPAKGSLARIVQTDPMRVTFPMTDRAYVEWRSALAKSSSPEMRLRLVLPNGDLYSKDGLWDFSDNEMSRETATIIMRLLFPNPERLLVPNSYITLLVDRKTPPKKLCIPQQAIFDLTSGSRAVWVLDKKTMTVMQRVVTVGEMSEGWLPVLEGLKEGECVVISGISKLAPMMKVAFAEPTSNIDIDPNYTSPVKE
jgi:membrane fusion protein (multidrug efflux system)